MGLKCSVLGHAFGETEVERDREEQGSEVVITIREVETCERCGHERIVSENKEVTAIETPDDAADEPAEPAADEADVESAGDDPADEDVADEAPVAEAIDEAEADSGVDDVGEVPTDADQGAEIIEDGPAEPVDDELANPSVEEPEPADEPPVTDEEHDAVFIDEEDEDDEPEDERAPGEWPEEPEDESDDWTPDSISVDQVDDGPERTESDAAVTVPEGQFRCPECGYTTAVESSSLRAGDFCPECHRGTLVNEPEEADGGTRKE